MENQKVKIQKSSDPLWTDEKGLQIPVNRISPVEKMKERHAAALLKDALRINKQLTDYKEKTTDLCNQVFEAAMKEMKNEGASKGNFTWYNFDRSIKIEVSIKDRITFDDLAIQACREKLNTFISENVDAKSDFIKEMILDAFKTTNGKLDPRRVTSLLTYEKKITDPLFQEALTHLKDAIRRPSSKAYFRMWAMLEDGSYQNIDLNFSSVS